jgi:hypothetical protein
MSENPRAKRAHNVHKSRASRNANPRSKQSLPFSSGHRTEREGFEPPDPCGSAVFKTATFSHSVTSPELSISNSGVLLGESC